MTCFLGWSWAMSAEKLWVQCVVSAQYILAIVIDGPSKRKVSRKHSKFDYASYTLAKVNHWDMWPDPGAAYHKAWCQGLGGSVFEVYSSCWRCDVGQVNPNWFPDSLPSFLSGALIEQLLSGDLVWGSGCPWWTARHCCIMRRLWELNGLLSAGAWAGVFSKQWLLMLICSQCLITSRSGLFLPWRRWLILTMQHLSRTHGIIVQGHSFCFCSAKWSRNSPPPCKFGILSAD